MPRPANGEPLAVYVHWPFCLSKCPYCDFNSHVRASVDEDAWERALVREIDHLAPTVPGRVVGSIFFGGGTPSLMAARTVAAVIDRVAARWPLADDLEITLEANPTSVECARLEAYRAAGVNRVSLGVQALDDGDLAFLGRHHSAAEARRAVASAQAVFPRTSFDLIYNRPGQTAIAWRRELGRALTIAGGHLSAYQLTLEPGTVFSRAAARGDLRLPYDDMAATLYEITGELIEGAGLAAYEVSNHALPGDECRHNLTYWRGGEYLGIGPGAHGRVTDDGGVRARRQIRSPEAWLAAVMARGHGSEAEEIVTADERVREILMMGLRLSEGVSRVRFRHLTGQGLETALAADRVTALTELGLVILDDENLRVTSAGRPVLNAVLGEILL